MAEPVTSLVRGPLKYVVETSTPQTEAGKEFSVSVRIMNPYEVPVTVKRVITKLPAKFIAADELKRQIGSSALKNLSFEIGFFPFGAVKLGGDVVQAVGVGAEENEPDVPLQPGNSTVRVFTVRTVNALFFVPSLYNLNIEVEYEIDGHLNHDTVSYQMNIRAPLGAIITGAVIGASVGYIVRITTDASAVQTLLKTPLGSTIVVQFTIGLITSVLIAGIVVVAFARKKDAQPILAIEDFWGGLFVGFLSAYGGTALLSKVSAGAA